MKEPLWKWLNPQNWPPWKYVLVYCLTVLAAIAFLGYHQYLFLSPQGLHIYRQTDSLSFVAYYFHHGMHFFQPGIYNLGSGTTGGAASEFPLFYYLTALIYQFTGEKDFILRIIHMLVLFTGLFFFSKALVRIFDDVFYGLVLSLLFISSSIILYYAGNFIPDIPALGFCLGGWGLFLTYAGSGKRSTLLAGMIFFTLAGLLKVTTLINPMTVFIILLIDRHLISSKSKGLTKSSCRDGLWMLLGVLVIVTSWLLFVFYYNAAHQNHFFLTGIMPWWGIDEDGRAMVWDHIRRYWYTKYYYESALHVFTILAIIGLVIFWKSHRLVYMASIILGLGGMVYFFLFFQQFRDHDYYFITLVPPIIMLVINGLLTLKHIFPQHYKHFIPKLGILTLLLLSLNYARINLDRRYNHQDHFTAIGEKFYGSRDFLDSLNIELGARVIVIGDPTPNASLYFLNRQGWTLPAIGQGNEERLQDMLHKDAAYIITTVPEQKDTLRSMEIAFLSIGKYKTIEILSLK